VRSLRLNIEKRSAFLRSNETTNFFYPLGEYYNT